MIAPRVDMVKPEEDAGVLQPSKMKDDWWFQHTKSLKLTTGICLLVFVFKHEFVFARLSK